MEIADRYFYLSDYATDPEKLAELCDLFAKDAIVEPNKGTPIQGEEKVNAFFKEFFSKNTATKHLWKTVKNPDGTIQVNWGVVVLRKSGELFTLTGSDYLTIQNNKITHLKIVGN